MLFTPKLPSEPKAAGETSRPILDPRPDRPKLGIALGAGAARGWSHIGILQELAANGVHPDIIAGTSIGAVVGGCYSAGKLESLEAFARGLTKKRVLSLMDVSFSGSGLICGTRLRNRLDRELIGIQIESLDKTFGAVATEIYTGHEIWLSKGDLVHAMRASYALPGIFEPVRVNGRWLYDGALVNPVPVTVCRALGADLVIAANLIGDNAYRGRVITDHTATDPTLEALAEARSEAELQQTDEPHKNRFFGDMGRNLRRQFGKRADGAPGMASAMLDAFNITQGRISRSRLAGDPPDLMINARLGKVGLFDFHRADELIAIGREATRRIMPDIIDCLAIRPQSGDVPPL